MYSFEYTYIGILDNVNICIHMLRTPLVSFFADLNIGVISYLIFSTRRVLFCRTFSKANGTEDFAEKSRFLLSI